MNEAIAAVDALDADTIIGLTVTGGVHRLHRRGTDVETTTATEYRSCVAQL
jgi:hypothetical protein